MFAAIANGGNRITPQLQKGSDALTRRQPINLSPTTLEELQQGLRAVVTRGTGKVLNIFYSHPWRAKAALPKTHRASLTHSLVLTPRQTNLKLLSLLLLEIREVAEALLQVQ